MTHMLPVKRVSLGQFADSSDIFICDCRIRFAQLQEDIVACRLRNLHNAFCVN